MVTVSAPALIGREDVLAVATGALSGEPTLVLIQGEPGIGKTRLLQEALAAAPDRLVLLAACPPLREPFPLGPVVDGLRRLRDRAGQVRLSPLAGALRPLLPEWADQLPPACEPLGDPQETRHRLFRALTELVERLAVEVPPRWRQVRIELASLDVGQTRQLVASMLQTGEISEQFTTALRR